MECQTIDLQPRGTVSARSRIAFLIGVAIALLSGRPEAFAAEFSPAGLWRTSSAVVQVSADANGILSAKIVKSLDPNVPPDLRCTACSGARKDQPIIGMTFIEGVKPIEDGWDEGTVLNPADGRIYRCRIRLLEGGQTLEMRGYVGTPTFGTSQMWVRER